MRDLNMQLLQGALTLGGSYSTADALIPRVDFVLDIRDFDIQSSLKYLPSLGKFAPIAEKATGRFSAKLDYASALTSDMSPEYSTVNASGSLQTRGVTIANAGFFNTLSDELKIDLFRSFKLNDLSIPFKIVKGDVHTSPFDIRLGKSTLTVEGVTSLDETIRYVMKLAIPRSEFGGAANNLLNNMVKQASATGLDIKPGETVHLDILATGTVTKPVFKLGLKGSMQNLADDLKDQAQQIIKQEIENIVDDIKDQANAAMEAAEKKAQQIIAEAEVKARQIREEAKKAGDKLIAEADAQGQKLISEAKNPITKEAAKAAAKKLRDEAQKSADKLNAEADKQASEVVNKARGEAEKVRNDAKKNVN
jgi:vacuolar-type H+-ATPase subunit H